MTSSRLPHNPTEDTPTPDFPPETICQDCGLYNPTWVAPNDLWNKVVTDGTSFLCPTCFIKRAEASGIVPTAWTLQGEQLDSVSTFGDAQSSPPDQQDDKQLREAIDAIFNKHFVAEGTSKISGQWGYHIPSVKKDLLALFTAAQLQLVSELIEQRSVTFLAPGSGVPVEVLEHKLKELK